MNKPDNIPVPCKRCTKNTCEGLHWKEFLVFPDIFAVPFDCPLRVEDESKFRWELQSLSDYDVSRIAGDVWVRHNFGARYGNGKQDEIEHIMIHFRQNKCIMITKSQSPSYKPWTQFGRWARSQSFSGMVPIEKKKEEDLPEGEDMPEQTVEQKPLEIKAAGLEHLDEALQKEQYRKVAQGDKVKLLAEVDGANEGEAIKFEIYYSTNKDSSMHFDTVTGTIKDGIGSAEWTVDLTKPLKESDDFEIKHEPVVRGKYGKPCSIGRREAEPGLEIELQDLPGEDPDDVLVLTVAADETTTHRIRLGDVDRATPRVVRVSGSMAGPCRLSLVVEDSDGRKAGVVFEDQEVEL